MAWSWGALVGVTWTNATLPSGDGIAGVVESTLRVSARPFDEAVELVACVVGGRRGGQDQRPVAARPETMRLGFGDAGNRPQSDTTRQAYDLLAEGENVGMLSATSRATLTRAGSSGRCWIARLQRFQKPPVAAAVRR